MAESTIYKEVFFDAAHRLMHHPGQCSRLHGHRWRLETWITGPVDERDGMVADFGEVSDLADSLDHAAILNEEDPLVEAVSELQEPILVEGDPTSENLIDRLWGDLEKELNEDVEVTRMKLYETPSSSAVREA